jgi:uncharacterized protein
MKKLTLLLLLVSSMVAAQIPDPQPRTYINDLAGVVHDADKQAINRLLREVETQFGVQMAIVLVDHLPANYEIEDYAREIGRKWHVGNAKNGIVYIASIQEHKQRLEIASHLEGIIPDITAKHLTDELKPYFRAQCYGAGLLALIGGITEKLQPAKEEQQKLTADELKKKRDNQSSWLPVGLTLGGIASLISLIFFWVKQRKRKVESETEPPSTVLPGYMHSSYIIPTFSNQEQNYMPQSRNYDDDYTTPSRSYDSDSSSSSSSNSSDYGDWGSGSSDNSSSSDSGFGGGGSSTDW